MKKIISLVLVLVLALTAIGGTLAYFTDTDNATNTLTVGGVQIDLHEANADGAKDEAYQTWLGEQVLMPGTSKQNVLDKIVTVENTGASDAYVRVHVAIPSALVDQEYDSFNDVLHMNMSRASFADGLWCWLPQYTTGEGWIGNGAANKNVYKTTIDGEDYNVWIITYRTALAPNAITSEPAIFQLYMDKFVDMDDAHQNYVKPYFTDEQGGNVDASKSFTWPVNEKINVLVFAEGVQEEGFTDAYAAFDAAFPTPSATANPWNNYGK